MLGTSLLRKIKIRWRLIISFLILSIIPLMIIGFMAYNNARSTLTNVIKQYTTQVINQFGDNVTKEIQKYMDIANSFVNSNLMQSEYPKYNSLDRFKKINLNNEILKELTLKAAQNQEISGLLFFPASGENAIYSGSDEFGIPLAELVETFIMESLPFKWYIDDEGRLAYARKTDSISSGSKLGTTFVTLKPGLISKSFDGLMLGDEVEIMLMTEEGQILHTNRMDYHAGTFYPDTSLVESIISMQSLAEGDGQKSLELDLGSEGYCSFYKVQGTPFYIIIKVPNSYLNSSALEIGYKINDVSIISIVVALILSIWVEKSISTPLKKLVAMTKETKQGNFTSTIDDKSHDEVGEAISNFNQAISNIKDLIHRVKLSCSEVLKSSSQISTSSEQAYLTADQIAVTLQELARGSTEQAHEAMQSVGYMNNLAEGINKVTANLYEITELIKRTEDITVAAISDVELLNNKALLTKSASIKIQEEINDLNRDMQEINNIIKVISQVSDQTNLLSLNATIEAARAGEAGRGFAVVAEEIKKLAEQTRASSKTIENMLREISEKTQKTVTEAGMAHNTIMDQIAAVDLTNKAFYNISDSMKEITVLMNNMESSVAEMHDQKIKTQLSLENISSVSEESAAISEEVSAATEEQRNSAQGLSNLSKEMNEIAINLEEAISLFKV